MLFGGGSAGNGRFVEHLRALASDGRFSEAADEIKRLRSELADVKRQLDSVTGVAEDALACAEKAEAALKPFAAAADRYDDVDERVQENGIVLIKDLRAARDVLKVVT